MTFGDIYGYNSYFSIGRSPHPLSRKKQFLVYCVSAPSHNAELYILLISEDNINPNLFITCLLIYTFVLVQP